jgi:hypothetical protein
MAQARADSGEQVSALEPFLREAMKQSAKIDLHLVSGGEFQKVTVNELLNGTVEIQKAPGQRRYVIATEFIVWAVTSN